MPARNKAKRSNVPASRGAYWWLARRCKPKVSIGKRSGSRGGGLPDEDDMGSAASERMRQHRNRKARPGRRGLGDQRRGRGADYRSHAVRSHGTQGPRAIENSGDQRIRWSQSIRCSTKRRRLRSGAGMRLDLHIRHEQDIEQELSMPATRRIRHGGPHDPSADRHDSRPRRPRPRRPCSTRSVRPALPRASWGASHSTSPLTRSSTMAARSRFSIRPVMPHSAKCGRGERTLPTSPCWWWRPTTASCPRPSKP